MAANMGNTERRRRVAVIGSGPSGFYACEALLAAGSTASVDLYDSLPTPFGLVRYGVAPDHAKIKSVIRVYERTAQRDGFTFFGNVSVGRDIGVEELRSFYDAIVFANGAQTDKRLGIPGEDLPGSYTATEFVAWYNGHPDYRSRTFDLSHDVAVVIGQGNVAVDVARILCKTPEELKDTDIAAHALAALRESRVREVHMVGRRGPAQAAFTPPEIREFGELVACDPVVDPADLQLSPESRQELEENSEARRNVEALVEFSKRAPTTKPKRFVVRFCLSPVELRGAHGVERVRLERNRLTGEPGRQRAVGTGESSELACGAFFRSVGYRGVALPGVPFDERSGTFPNLAGRIVRDGQPIPGLYAVGWIKRGPTGVIGTNKPDSIETVKNLLADLPTLRPCPRPDSEVVRELLTARGVRVVDYDAWRRIDAAEVARGQAAGKPREKFVTIEEMLEAAR
jgi:ferredoxin--NADP+ reductase